MVQPDGIWSHIVEGDPSPGGSRDSSEDDDDLVEIKDPPCLSSVKSMTNNSTSSMRTPPASSREQSSSSVAPSTGAKRSSSAVIDLTSDDDDEDRWRSSKRPTMPLYPTHLGYDQTDNSRPSSGAVSSATQRSYMTNPLSKPNYVHRGYSHPRWTHFTHSSIIYFSVHYCELRGKETNMAQ